MITHRCKNCIWWDNEHKDVEAKDTGFCRKHKPAAMNINGKLWGFWPLTDQNAFCGEFREEKT